MHKPGDEPGQGVGYLDDGTMVVVNNALIRTESTGGVTRSFQGTGVRCNGCVKVSRNTIAGVLGVGFHYCESLCRFSATGLFMNGEAIVDRNRISGGCTVDGSATGLSTSGYTRIENNVIVGTSGVCLPAPGLKAPYLVMGLSASGLVDVHSNYIDSGDLGRLEPGGPSLAVTTCTLRGISYGGTTGVFRNNRIRGGIVECRVGSTNSSSAFFEATAETTPAFVENNSLLGNYVDGGTNAPVNTPGSGNTYWCASDGPVLLAGSTCINTGTPTGAPRFDIDGELRDVAPDIGPDEFSN